jgi:hypothetical protein
MGVSDFEAVIPALADGWRVLALDRRGHGDTHSIYTGPPLIL